MPREDYNEHREARIERLRGAAERAAGRSESAYKRGRIIMDGIPFGQPILVGHHSEAHARADVRRIDNSMRKSSEEATRAKDLNRRADAAEANRSISGDDPEAVVKLEAKLAKMEAQREEYKRANKAIKRKGATAETIAEVLKVSIGTAKKLLTPDFAGRVGFPPYVLSNLGANIRRIQKRIETLEAAAGDTTTMETVGDVRVVDDVEANRLRLYFPGKPDDETRRKLKMYGFRWARSEGCWQSYRGNGARSKARIILGESTPGSDGGGG